jgi:hypothetical protein
MTKEYGPDSSLWKLSVAAAARWGTEDEIEVMIRSGSKQFRVDLGTHLMGMRKAMDWGDFAPSPGSTIEKIHEEMGWGNGWANVGDGEGPNAWDNPGGDQQEGMGDE